MEAKIKLNKEREKIFMGENMITRFETRYFLLKAQMMNILLNGIQLRGL